MKNIKIETVVVVSVIIAIAAIVAFAVIVGINIPSTGNFNTANWVANPANPASPLHMTLGL